MQAFFPTRSSSLSTLKWSGTSVIWSSVGLGTSTSSTVSSMDISGSCLILLTFEGAPPTLHKKAKYEQVLEFWIVESKYYYYSYSILIVHEMKLVNITYRSWRKGIYSSSELSPSSQNLGSVQLSSISILYIKHITISGKDISITQNENQVIRLTCCSLGHLLPPHLESHAALLPLQDPEIACWRQSKMKLR